MRDAIRSLVALYLKSKTRYYHGGCFSKAHQAGRGKLPDLPFWSRCGVTSRKCLKESVNASERTGGWVITLFVVFLGMIFLFPAGVKVTRYVFLCTHSTAVTGTVTRAGMGNYMGAKPYVTFTDHHGRVHEIKSRVNYHWFFSPAVGSKMRVRYPSNQPENAIVDSYLHYLIIPMVFVLIGVYILYCLFFRARKTERQANRNAANES